MHHDNLSRLLAVLEARAMSRANGRHGALPSQRTIDDIEHDIVVGSEVDDR